MIEIQRGRPKKKLLVLTSTFPRWKDDEDPPFVYELCSRMKNDFHIHVLAPHFKGAATSENFDGIKVTRFRYFFSKWETLCYEGGILANLRENRLLSLLTPFFLFFLLITTLRLIKKYNFDLIHSHWLIPQGVIALFASAFVRKPPKLLCTSHGGDLYGLQGSMFKRIKSITIEKSHAVTVVSNSMKATAAQLTHSIQKIHVIPMGTDLKQVFFPIDRKESGNKILFVGRLVEKKGLRYLIDAFPLVMHEFPETNLDIVGDGPGRTELKQRAMRLGVNNNIHFRGAVSKANLPIFYNDADVFVFPSVIGEDGDREGFGLVLVEAMGCGCAVISTNLEAMKDIITDGVTGLVVSQRDRSQLSGKINMLLGDPTNRKRMGARARADVLEKFDWDVISDKYKALIGSII